MARKFTKYPSNYVKATAYYVPKTQMGDWEQIARAYAKKVGAELLFVNENSFGIEYSDGTMQHIRVEDLAELLGAGDINASTDIKASDDSNIKYIQSEWQFSPSDYDYSLPLPKHIGFCGCGGRSWVSLDSNNLDTWGSCEEAVEDAKQNYKPGSHIYIYKIDMNTREILDYCDEVKISKV